MPYVALIHRMIYEHTVSLYWKMIQDSETIDASGTRNI